MPAFSNLMSRGHPIRAMLVEIAFLDVRNMFGTCAEHDVRNMCGTCAEHQTPGTMFAAN